MDTPYREQYGLAEPSQELLEKILAAQTPDEQKEIFLDYFSDAQSPYEFFGLVWGDFDTSDYPFDVPRLLLDHVVASKRKWDADEAACFLLQVADNHARFVDDPHWLIAVDMPGMWELEYAHEFIWEMFCEGHRDLILTLARHFGWDEILAKADQKHECE